MLSFEFLRIASMSVRTVVTFSSLDAAWTLLAKLPQPPPSQLG